jgi:hypothetical protein
MGIVGMQRLNTSEKSARDLEAHKRLYNDREHDSD